jgi:hypothetical protein
VDINPMAVELCKVSLWMEALEPGKPLSFLDSHVQCGNSLLGATPTLLEKGIPDEAFTPIEGDDKKLCAEYKRQNRDERRGQRLLLPAEAYPWQRLGDLSTGLAQLDTIADDSLDGVRKKQQRYEEIVRSTPYLFSRLWADAWCASFVWKKTKEFSYAITEEAFRAIEKNPHSIAPWMRHEIQRLARQYQFFHWHLAFPSVFRAPGKEEKSENEQIGWIGGFDIVLGNPPWERIKLQEQEWFASRRPDIADARNATERRRMIANLRQEDPVLLEAFLNDRRKSEGESHVLRNSTRFPLCGRGDVNTYALFAECNRQLIKPNGRVGCVLPPGIVTDDTTKFFFQDLVDGGGLVSFYSFENEEYIFPGIDHRVMFALLTMAGSGSRIRSGDIVFFARRTSQLQEPDRHFQITADDVRLLNPNTRTCPIFRSRRDSELTKAVRRRIPVLISETTGEDNPWDIQFLRMFDMANDSDLFQSRQQLVAEGFRLQGNVFCRDRDVFLPVYEAKMLHHFDHRFSTYEGQTEAQANMNKLPELNANQHTDPFTVIIPRYWIPEREVVKRLSGKWEMMWLLGWRDITYTTNERTVIGTLHPRVAVGHTFPLILPGTTSAPQVALLGANMSTFVLDYLARQKIGGTHLTYGYLKQFPILRPESYDSKASWYPSACLRDWLFPRVLELTYTAWDLEPFAKDCGYDGAPFRWDEERRFWLRAELDAAYFHLYGIARDDVDYILETFPIVKRKDIVRHGTYRTKAAILEIYDALADSIRTGYPYQTRLIPPPADPRVAHAPRAAVFPTRPQVDSGRAIVYVQMLLRTSKVPVDHETVVAGVVLMFKDAIRKAVLTGQSVAPASSAPVVRLPVVEDLDGLIRGLLQGQILSETLRGDRRFYEVGPKAEPLAQFAEHHWERAREALQAVGILGASRVMTAYAAGVSHEELSLV